MTIWNPSNYPNGVNGSDLISTRLGYGADYNEELDVTEYNGTILSKKSITLTSAQILALRATPVLCVVAPGAGKTYFINRIVTTLNYETAAYTVVNTALQFYIGDPGAGGVAIGASTATPAIFTSTASSMFRVPTPDLMASSTLASITNKAIYVKNSGAAEFLAGDSTLTIDFYIETKEV